MKCPQCGYEPTLAEIQRSPDSCVECGVVYAQYEQNKRLHQSAAVITTASPVAGAVKDVLREFPGAQPVVVVDFRMGFGSMVNFMVKWALASIPALVILLVLGWGLLSILSLFGGPPLRPPRL